MAHVTVYLSNDIEHRVRNAAKRNKVTLNKWITAEITKAVKDMLPESFLQAAGAVPDFPSLEKIRSGYGKDRRRKAL
jgi:hypothetical protein